MVRIYILRLVGKTRRDSPLVCLRKLDLRVMDYEPVGSAVYLPLSIASRVEHVVVGCFNWSSWFSGV